MNYIKKDTESRNNAFGICNNAFKIRNNAFGICNNAFKLRNNAFERRNKYKTK